LQGVPAGQTPLTFGDMPVAREVSDVGATAVPSVFENGGINILAPTAAGVTINGRVLTPGGLGVSKALITLVGSDGVPRNALTNPFGYFRFDDVLVGGTYVLSVSHKRHQFAPRSLTVYDEISEFNFIAEE
jgi:hypothetical protein